MEMIFCIARFYCNSVNKTCGRLVYSDEGFSMDRTVQLYTVGNAATVVKYTGMAEVVRIY